MSPSNRATPWPGAFDAGRVFADALQEGLARSAGLRGMGRRGGPSTLAAARPDQTAARLDQATGSLLDEQIPAVPRRFAAGPPTALEPAEPDDP
jgi:hypothetical protein